MKNIYKLTVCLAVAAAFVSCTVKEVDEPCFSPLYEEFYATIELGENVSTRLYADDRLRILWNADDRISIFNLTTYNREYRFRGADGDNAGSFEMIDDGSFVTGNQIPSIYAVYPYSASNKISNDEVLSVSFPAVQTWAEGTFGRESIVMVSAGTDNNLFFKHAGGVLVFKVYGTGKVSSVTLRGNSGEKLGGLAGITMSAGGVPAVSMSSQASEELTLTCPEPVAVGADAGHYTEFWFCLPPVTFTAGFTVTFNGPGSSSTAQSTSKSITIARSSISRMAPFEVALDEAAFQPDNEIWYTSTDGNIVVPNNDSLFGANMISNTYSEGKGIMKFDGPVTKIGDKSYNSSADAPFNYCRKLKSVSLPETVEMIGFCAFMGCTSLESIEMPEHLAYCGNSILSNTALKTFNMPETDEWSNYNPTSSCPGLSCFTGPYASVDGKFLIENGVIRSFAAAGATSCEIPEGITGIGSEAFTNCSKLVSISFPSTLETIQSQAFTVCSSLKELVLPESLGSIDYAAFSSCTSLETVVMPQEVSLHRDVFNNCVSLKSISGAHATSDGRLIVDSYGNTNAFAPGGLTEYSVPEGVLSLLDGFSFYNNYYNRLELETLSLPASLLGISLRMGVLRTLICYATTPPAISSDYYLDIPDIESIYVPASSVDAYKTASVWSNYAERIKPIEEEEIIEFADSDIKACLVAAFDSNNDGEISKREAAAVTSLQGVFQVGQYGSPTSYKSFDEFQYFTSVKKIETDLFWHWGSLESIVLPEGLETIEPEAFTNCIKLTDINFPSTLTKIGSSAFFGCDGLTSVHIPENVMELGHSVFQACHYLQSFSGKFSSADGYCLIVDGVLNSFAYAGLTDYTFPSSITSFGYSALRNCRFNGSLTLGPNVKRLEAEAFAYTSYIKKLTLNEGLEYIGGSAFRGLGRNMELIVPSTVNSMGQGSFASSFSRVIFTSAVPPQGSSGMLTDSYSKTTFPVFVPAGSLEAYKSADYWSDYFGRIFSMPEAVDLGLPSGRKWASFNLGASTPSAPGYYYSWGETLPKSSYEWSNYKWGDYNAMTKYNLFESSGTVDGKSALDPEDDAARFAFSGSWRIPTPDDWSELRSKCNAESATIDGVDGYVFTSKSNGASIFIPVTGKFAGTGLISSDEGSYWTSTLTLWSSDTESNYARAFCVEMEGISYTHSSYGCPRYYGLVIRPVCD
jgi:hypothetical protein